MSQSSIVEYFGLHKDYKCGYCKCPDKNSSHGMWAHFLTAQDYQGLINRGWRRSGKYCYKPTNNVACCPAYTISCRALEFKLSKSQKKVLKRFRQYICGKELAENTTNRRKSDSGESAIVPEAGGSENITRFVPKDGQEPSTLDAMQVCTDDSNSVSKENSVSETEADASKFCQGDKFMRQPALDKLDGNCSAKPVKKAKLIRIERKRQKLLAKGIDPSTLISKRTESVANRLEDYMNYGKDVKKKLEVKTIKVGTRDFQRTFDLELSLYKRYQMTIHNDEEDECSASQFKRFLCDSPILEGDDPRSIFGCHHQQYFVDGQLLAVGVIDILPECVSSVYFFYSPDHMQLSLGTFGALREIAFTRELQRTHPRIQYYYLGFYIHSCPKMRYKGSFSPSYLLCPEEYTWHLLDDEVRARLTASKYIRLNPEPPTSTSQVDVDTVPVLYSRKRTLYKHYRLATASDDLDEVKEYAELVGPNCAHRILLYRDS